MFRRLWQSGRGGRGRGEPPAYTRPVGNPYREPAFIAQLQRAIIWEHKQQTGETPWNNNRGNVPTDDHTGVASTSKFSSQSKGPQSSTCTGQYNGRTQTKSPVQSCGHEDKAPWFLFLFDIHSHSSSLPHLHSVTIHMDSFLFFSHSLHSDLYFPHLWLIILTLAPQWLTNPYCTFTIYWLDTHL